MALGPWGADQGRRVRPTLWARELLLRKQGRPSRAAGWTRAEERTQEARSSGGTCRVTTSGTWALSSLGRGHRTLHWAPERGLSRSPGTVWENALLGGSSHGPRGSGVTGLSLLTPGDPPRPVLSGDASCLHLWMGRFLRLDPQKLAQGLDGLTVQGPPHPSCPLGLSEINPPVLESLVSVPGSPRRGALKASLTPST